MNEYTIESNIPVGPRAGGRRPTWKKLAEQMSPGDSVLVATRSNANGLRMAIARLGYQGTIRLEGNAIRVWKLEVSRET